MQNHSAQAVKVIAIAEPTITTKSMQTTRRKTLVMMVPTKLKTQNVWLQVLPTHLIPLQLQQQQPAKFRRKKSIIKRREANNIPMPGNSAETEHTNNNKIRAQSADAMRSHEM